MENQNPIYLAISYLLQYPDFEMKESILELLHFIQTCPSEKVREPLLAFTEVLEKTPIDELERHYIEQFDFGRGTNLYITYMKLGEQRERGLELLKLKSFYQAHGFEMTDKELSDYLPLMLEFCGNVPAEVSNELLQMHIKAIQEIGNRLKESNSYYALVFDSLNEMMLANGLVNPEVLPAQSSN